MVGQKRDRPDHQIWRVLSLAPNCWWSPRQLPQRKTPRFRNRRVTTQTRRHASVSELFWCRGLRLAICDTKLGSCEFRFADFGESGISHDPEFGDRPRYASRTAAMLLFARSRFDCQAAPALVRDRHIVPPGSARVPIRRTFVETCVYAPHSRRYVKSIINQYSEELATLCIRGGRSRLWPNDAQRRGNRRLGITGDRDAPVGVARWIVESVQWVRSYGSARSLGGRLNTAIVGRTYELEREGAIFPSGAVRYDWPRYVGQGVHSGGA